MSSDCPLASSPGKHSYMLLALMCQSWFTLDLKWTQSHNSSLISPLGEQWKPRHPWPLLTGDHSGVGPKVCWEWSSARPTCCLIAPSLHPQPTSLQTLKLIELLLLVKNISLLLFTRPTPPSSLGSDVTCSWRPSLTTGGINKGCKIDVPPPHQEVGCKTGHGSSNRVLPRKHETLSWNNWKRTKKKKKK
jgi:hypothetical protein